MSSTWTPNDYSNIITIGAAAIGSVLLIIFKSKCSKINLCCGLLSCDRTPQEDDTVPQPDEVVEPPVAP